MKTLCLILWVVGTLADCDSADSANTYCHRRIQFSPKDDKVNIKAENTGATGQLKSDLSFDIELDDKHGAEVATKYQVKNKTGASQMQVKIEFDLTLLALLEVNSSVGYKEGDTVLSTLLLTDWSNFNASSNKQADNTTLYQFSSTANKVFRLKGVIADSLISVPFPGNPPTPLSPNYVKFDFDVLNFPYTAPGKSSLVLVSCISSSVKGKEQDGSTKIEFKEENGDMSGLFGWVNYVMADGEKVGVTQTTGSGIPGPDPDKPTKGWCSNADGQAEVNYFTITTTKAAKQILWDPVVGIAFNPASDSHVLEIVLGILGGVAFLIVIVFCYLRRAPYKEQGLNQLLEEDAIPEEGYSNHTSTKQYGAVKE